MKQPYNFEHVNPPILNESMLRETLAKRRLFLQTTLIAIAGILLQILVTIFGLLAADDYPALACICLAYVLISAIGGCVIAATYAQKGGILL